MDGPHLVPDKEIIRYIYEGSRDDWLCQNKIRQRTLNLSIISSFHLLEMYLKLYPLDEEHDCSSFFTQNNTKVHKRLWGSAPRLEPFGDCVFSPCLPGWNNISGTNKLDFLEALNWREHKSCCLHCGPVVKWWLVRQTGISSSTHLTHQCRRSSERRQMHPISSAIE